MKSQQQLTIIQMNDTHGYVEEHWEHFWDGDYETYKKVGGYARMKAHVDNLRQRHDNVLMLDNGDTFHGTYPVVQSKGEILPDLLNDFGLDGMSAHWEFAYGPAQFKKLVGQLNYPMLAINCYDEASDALVFPPYIIKEFDELKVGVIGIAANIIDKVMPQHFSEGLYFTLGEEELPKYIEEVNDAGVDLVVVLSHLGFPQEVNLAEKVDGIDVLLSGHTHNRLYKPSHINDTLIIQSGCHGSFLGQLELTIEDKRIVDYDHNLIVLDNKVEQDPLMNKKIESIMNPYREKLSTVVGKTSTDLNRNTVLESTMDNFLLQSLLDLTGSQVAFSNGWRYGAPIPKGSITENDLWNMIPVNPPVSIVELTGKEIWAMIEENLERTFAKDPYDQKGGYVKRSMGVNVYFKIENPSGNRIQQIFVQGEPIEFKRVYEAVFVTTQGVPAKYGKNRKNLDVKAIEALKRYLNRCGVVEAKINSSYVAV